MKEFPVDKQFTIWGINLEQRDSLTDKKQKHKRRVLTEEKLDDIRATDVTGSTTVEVSRRLPTEVARVRSQVIRDFWWDGFSPSSSVSPANSHSTDTPYSSTISSGADTIGLIMAGTPSGLISPHLKD
jgi:hypothetical protein